MIFIFLAESTCSVKVSKCHLSPPPPTLQANLNPHFCGCLSLFYDKAATIFSNTLSSKSHNSLSLALVKRNRALGRCSQSSSLLAPHLVDIKEVSSYFGNFDSIKLISANVFYKGSSGKYLRLPVPIVSLVMTHPCCQSVNDKLTCQRQEWLSSHNTLFTNAGCGSDSALGPCGLWTLAQTTDQPLCALPLFILRDQFHFKMNSTQWRKARMNTQSVTAAAFIEDVSLFGRVALQH